MNKKARFKEREKAKKKKKRGRSWHNYGGVWQMPQPRRGERPWLRCREDIQHHFDSQKLNQEKHLKLNITLAANKFFYYAPLPNNLDLLVPWKSLFIASMTSSSMETPNTCHDCQV
jgi:hypothetical protein